MEEEEEEEIAAAQLSSQFLCSPGVCRIATMSQIIVVKVDVHNDKEKQKAMKAVSSLQGIDLLSMDMNERKMTVIGTVDAVAVTEKLRERWHTSIVSVGDDDRKKKKEEEEKKKKEEAEKKKKEEAEKLMKETVEKCNCNPCLNTHYYIQSADDNPNACAIL